MEVVSNAPSGPSDYYNRNSHPHAMDYAESEDQAHEQSPEHDHDHDHHASWYSSQSATDGVDHPQNVNYDHEYHNQQPQEYTADSQQAAAYSEYATGASYDDDNNNNNNNSDNNNNNYNHTMHSHTSHSQNSNNHYSDVNDRFNAEYPQDGEYPDMAITSPSGVASSSVLTVPTVAPPPVPGASQDAANSYFSSSLAMSSSLPGPSTPSFAQPVRPSSTGGSLSSGMRSSSGNLRSSRRPTSSGSPRTASPSPRHTLSHSHSMGFVAYQNGNAGGYGHVHRRTNSSDFGVNTPRSEHSGCGSDMSVGGLPTPSARSTFYQHSRRPSTTSLMSDQFASASMFDLSQSYIMPLFNDDKNKQNVMPRLKTIELYRKNAKKSNDPIIQFQFAQYMLQTALRAGAKLPSSTKSQIDLNATASMSSPSLALSNGSTNPNSNGSTSSAASSSSDPMRDSTSSEQQDNQSATTPMSPLSANFTGPSGGNSTNAAGSAGLAGIDEKVKKDLLKEALSILRKLSDRGYADAQYLLADAFASGALGRKDMRESFTLFQLAAKHGHGEAAYRTALCLEQGWGTSKDARRSLQFLRMAASRNQPGAMLRLGMACFYGRMGLNNTVSTKLEGVKWLKLAANEANEVFPQAPYELARIIQHGYKDVVIPDVQWALQLYVRSAELRHVPAARILGKAYEHGELGCPQNAGLSIHYYTIGAQGGDPESMLALCAWYTVGARDVLPVNHEEAFEWALRSANSGYAKAQCAVGYFLERGIGCERDIFKSTQYYEKAAAAGHPSAIARLRRDRKAADPKSKKDKDCVIC